MASTQSQRTIAVLGATGNQGSGVVRALLSDQYSDSWLVRAVTQDPSSDKAQRFLSEYQTPDNRLSLASGNIYNEASLRSAFSGAYGVFAMTNEWLPNKALNEEWEFKHEIDAGTNIVSAAKECGVRHFVFSSLPDTVKASHGQLRRIHHMNNKHTIEQLARMKLDGFTSLIPGFFYTNLRWSHYCGVCEDGVVQFRMPLPGDKPMQWTDPAYDMGAFAAKIFHLGVEKTNGKTYLALGPKITPEDMTKVFTLVTGRPAVHSPISFEEFGELCSKFVGPAFKEDASEMMQLAAMAPADKTCYGAFELEAERANEELGLKASSFEDWLRRSGWAGP